MLCDSDTTSVPLKANLGIKISINITDQTLCQTNANKTH